MANISDKVAQIREATYGKEVRESIASGIEDINTEVESTTQRQTTLETDMADAKREAEEAAVRANTAAGDAEDITEALAVWEDYDPDADYIPMNKVVYQGSCYINIVACKGVLPTNQTNWLKIASKGLKGNTGAVPDISIGTVTTVAAGTSASVTRRAGSPDESPIFDFDIPKGVDGEGAGDMMASVYDPNNTASDAFSMNSMVESTTKKIMTADERTKLTGIETGANKTTVNNTLTSTSETEALSAAQGKALKEAQDAHKADNAQEHQQLFTSVSNGKSLVGTAITDLDPNVTVPTAPTFEELAIAIGQISPGKQVIVGTIPDFSVPNDNITYIGQITGLPFSPTTVIIFYTVEGKALISVAGINPFTSVFTTRKKTDGYADLLLQGASDLTSDGFKYYADSASSSAATFTNISYIAME